MSYRIHLDSAAVEMEEMLNGVLEQRVWWWGGKDEGCRSICRWESSEGRGRHAELYRRVSVVVALHSPIEGVGTGHCSGLR